jgi:hypothetical protein
MFLVVISMLIASQLDEAKLGIHVEADFGEAAKMAVRFAAGQ